MILLRLLIITLTIWRINISRFLVWILTLLVWMLLTTHVTLCVCHDELKDYLLTYLINSNLYRYRSMVTKSCASATSRYRYHEVYLNKLHQRLNTVLCLKTGDGDLAVKLMRIVEFYSRASARQLNPGDQTTVVSRDISQSLSPLILYLLFLTCCCQYVSTLVSNYLYKSVGELARSLLSFSLTLWRPLLPYRYRYKASCTRPG